VLRVDCAAVFGEFQVALPFDLVWEDAGVAVIGIACDANTGDEGRRCLALVETVGEGVLGHRVGGP